MSESVEEERGVLSLGDLRLADLLPTFPSTDATHNDLARDQALLTLSACT